MKYVILGGVAAGTKAAAKLKRCDQHADVIVYTKGEDISYAGCGLPYYIGGDIPNRESLIVNTPARYSGLTGAKVFPGCEATGIDSIAKTVSLKKTPAKPLRKTMTNSLLPLEQFPSFLR